MVHSIKLFFPRCKGLPNISILPLVVRYYKLKVLIYDKYKIWMKPYINVSPQEADFLLLLYSTVKTITIGL